MRANHSLLLLLSIAAPLSLPGQGVAEIGNRMKQVPAYLCDARFEVLLPSASDPVTYDITLQSQLPAKADSLAPCDYLIRWTTNSPSGPLSGFSAYFDGNHYRYRNNRLQEYHVDANPSVFQPTGAGSQGIGVQSQAQFAEMLPQFLGQKLIDMSRDSSYHMRLHLDTIVDGIHRIVIDGAKITKGYETLRFTYVIDKDTYLPVMSDLETSPGSISEQIVDHYYQQGSKSQALAINEESLMETWPEIFEKYRESNFRAESLANNPLPAFSTPLLGGGQRYNHQRGESLPAATVIAVLDPDVASTKACIDAMRDAVDSSPVALDIIFAFNSNHEGEIKSLIGNARDGETILSSASDLIRNCGVTLFPTIFLVAPDGTVKSVHTGYNNELGEIVIQEAALIRQ